MASIQNKIALVTGAASGIGLSYVKELFRNGLKGATIADIDPTKGDEALKEVAEEFGPNKAIFVKTDVTIQNEVEAAFKKTIEVFKNLDIVINNAGILNDSIWEKEIAININGTVYGVLLAWDYLPKYRSGNEGLIVNIASIAGLTGFSYIPLYTATKHAIIGLSRSIGVKAHYDKSKIRIITICPGVTETPLITDFTSTFSLPAFRHTVDSEVGQWPMQKKEVVAKGFIQAVTEGANGSFWVINDSKTQNITLPEVLEIP